MDVRMVSARRVFSHGNGENIAIEMQAMPDEGESGGEVAEKLIDQIEATHARQYGNPIEKE